MSNEITESEFRRHVHKCGVPKKYCNKEASLKLKSKTGELLHRSLSNKDSRKKFFETNKILNLYSNDCTEADDYVALCVRQLLIAGATAYCIDAYELAKMASEQEEITDLDQGLIYQAQYLGITNFDFMGSEGWPVDNSYFWNLREFLTRHVHMGRVLITGSSKPVRSIKCYPTNFVNYLVKNTKDVNLDAGH